MPQLGQSHTMALLNSLEKVDGMRVNFQSAGTSDMHTHRKDTVGIDTDTSGTPSALSCGGPLFIIIPFCD